MGKRRLSLMAMAAVMILGVTAPALATKPGTSGEATEYGHKISVCHATNSASNEYVVITIDVAAWEPGDEFVRHSPGHHENSKTDHVDAVYDGECPTVSSGPTDT